MPIEIKATLRMGNVLSRLAKMQTALDGINKSVATLNANLAGVSQNAGIALQALAKMKAPRSGGGSGSGGSNLPRRPGTGGRSKFDPFANDPAAGMRFYANAASQGHPRAAQMYGRYRGRFNSMQRNQGHAQNLLNGGNGQSSIAQMALRTFKRTRFGFGKAQILGIDLMQMMGMGGQAGAPGGGSGGGVASMSTGKIAGVAAIAGAIAGMKAFVAMVRSATSTLNEWRATLVAGGGTTGQAVAANSLGRFAGSDLAGVGKGLSPYAAAQLGVSPVTGPFGDMDYNGRGLKAMDAVRNSRSLTEARRKAELFGDPNLANSYLVSDNNYRAMRNQKGPNVDAMRSAADIQAASQRITDSFKHIVVDLMAPALKGVARTMEWVAGILERIRDWVQGLMKKFHLDDGNRDLKENTKALKDATQAVREGVFGGGGRANGATPSRFHPIFGGNPTPMGAI